MREAARDHHVATVVGPARGRASGVLAAGVGLVMSDALPTEHLPPGVTRVGQDRLNRPTAPSRALAVAVTVRIARRRARDATLGQQDGDLLGAEAVQPLGEDPADMPGGDRVRVEAFEPPPPTE